MTSNLDTQVRDPAATEATETKEPRMIGILDDADLAAVNGGEGFVANGVAHAVLQFYRDNTYPGRPGGFGWELTKDLYCP
jgi:hypothetical protein